MIFSPSSILYHVITCFCWKLFKAIEQKYCRGSRRLVLLTNSLFIAWNRIWLLSLCRNIYAYFLFEVIKQTYKDDLIFFSILIFAKHKNKWYFKYYKFAVIKTCENETAKSTMTNLKLQVTLLYLNFANKMLFVV